MSANNVEVTFFYMKYLYKSDSCKLQNYPNLGQKVEHFDCSFPEKCDMNRIILEVGK